MNHLHTDLSLQDGDLVEVELNGQANVMLMDRSNYDAYKNGRTYHYYGGHATRSPVRIPAPRAGSWHLVIDLGGFAGTISAGVRILRGAEAVGAS